MKVLLQSWPGFHLNKCNDCRYLHESYVHEVTTSARSIGSIDNLIPISWKTYGLQWKYGKLHEICLLIMDLWRSICTSSNMSNPLFWSRWSPKSSGSPTKSGPRMWVLRSALKGKMFEKITIFPKNTMANDSAYTQFMSWFIQSFPHFGSNQIIHCIATLWWIMRCFFRWAWLEIPTLEPHRNCPHLKVQHIPASLITRMESRASICGRKPLSG